MKVYELALFIFIFNVALAFTSSFYQAPNPGYGESKAWLEAHHPKPKNATAGALQAKGTLTQIGKTITGFFGFIRRAFAGLFNFFRGVLDVGRLLQKIFGGSDYFPNSVRWGITMITDIILVIGFYQAVSGRGFKGME